MARLNITLTGKEVTFGEDEIIVSKTDEKGIITYANNVFQRVCGYSEQELMGQPHNIIRHPAMPKCVFKLLWDTIKEDREIFAYVLNLTKYGDEYWVFAHITPSYNASGNRIGYHSNRRLPHRDAITQVSDLYRLLLNEEKTHNDSKAAMQASTTLLLQQLEKLEMNYDQFVFSLSEQTNMESSIS